MIQNENEYYLEARPPRLIQEPAVQGFLISLLVHALFLYGSGVLTGIFAGHTFVSPQYVTVTVEPKTTAIRQSHPVRPKETTTDPNSDQVSVFDPEVDSVMETSSIDTTITEVSEDSVSEFLQSIQQSDTTQLTNIYAESTLGVRVRFPLGWEFRDQNVNQTLDAVTFIGVRFSDAPPAYIFLEVREKDLFDPRKFEAADTTDEAVLYYGKETVMHGQVSFQVYFRTEEENDFLLKLIINGEEKFTEYKPVFLAMLKTFHFGK